MSLTKTNWSARPRLFGRHACRPVHDHRHVHAALVGVLLVPLERGVAALRPSPRVVGVAVGAADVVDARDGDVGRLEDAVEELHLVHHTERAALLAGPVVGEQDEDRVVELTHRLQSIDKATDLVVGVVEERGERLLQPGGQPLLVLGQRIPRLDTRVARREPSARGNDAALELSFEPPLAHDVPAFVEPAAVLGEVLRRCLVGRVGGAEGDVGEERSIGSHTLAVGDHLQHLVDDVLGDVVAVLGSAGRFDGVVVADELGVELVGLAVEEPVEAVEAARRAATGRRAGGGALLHRGEVPLADGERRVALVAQHLCHGGGAVADVAEHVREAGLEVRHRAHPGAVLGATGEQCGAGGGAQRGDVEVGELQPAGREGVDVRCVDVAAVAAELGEARVVEQDDDDVRGVLAGVGLFVEPRLGLGQRGGDLPLESFCAHVPEPNI